MAPAPSIQDLISIVVADCPDDEPLGRLSTAAALMREVGDTADAALGYFVDQARRSGRSWSEIGDALGVSKQAAQQRHGLRLGGIPVTFERFTERAKSVVAASEAAARDLGHGYIGTEHLLLAQYAEPDGLGAQALVEAGLPAEAVRSSIVDRVGEGPGTGDERPPFTPRAVEALKEALAVALELGHNYIGTEHLLLGVSRIEAGLAAIILREGGVDDDALRTKLMAKLTAVQKAAGKAPHRRPAKAATKSTSRKASG